VTLGSGSYIPGAKFASPRSYLAGIWFNFNPGSTVVWTDNFAHVTDAGGVVTAGVRFAPEFFVWSSNVYSLDFMVIESWYKVAPSPSEIPLPFLLQFYQDPVAKIPYIFYSPFSSPPAADYKHFLPFGPPDYWGPHFDF